MPDTTSPKCTAFKHRIPDKTSHEENECHSAIETQRKVPSFVTTLPELAGGHSPSYPQQRLDLAAALDPPWGSACLCVGGCVRECHSSWRDPGCPTTPPDSPTLSRSHASVPPCGDDSEQFLRLQVQDYDFSLSSFASSFPQSVVTLAVRDQFLVLCCLISSTFLPFLPPSFLTLHSKPRLRSWLDALSSFSSASHLLSLSFPSPFSPLINSIVPSCALSTISFLFLSYMLTCWLLILPRCTKNVMHSLSFSLSHSPNHPFTPSFYQKHLCTSCRIQLPPPSPLSWQSSRSCHIPLKLMWN